MSFTNQFNNGLNIVRQSTYYREQYQTFMTGPEWRSVEMFEELARFLKENNSIFYFPHFRQVAGLWGIFYSSIVAARQYDSLWKIITSDYMVMDLFVCIFTTLESIPKGLISLILFPFVNKNNPTEMQTHLSEFYADYALKLQSVPFYDHDYASMGAELREKYQNCQKPSWVDWFSWKLVSFELWAKGMISSPLSKWFHQEGGETPATTELIVKYKSEADNPAQDFTNKISDLKNVGVTLVGKFSVGKKNEHSYSSIYACLSVPRYMDFKKTNEAFSENKITTKLIAGQQRVQVKCVVDTEAQDLENSINRLKQMPDATYLYSYHDDIHPNRQICLFDVPVKKLQEVTEGIKKQKDVTLQFIHNF